MPNPWIEHRTLISQRIEGISHLLLALDFDGTLAPIVDRPETASMSRRTQDALDYLVTLPDVTIAILSGRSLADVAARVVVPNGIYCGNHGLEMRGSGLDVVIPEALGARDSLAGALMELEMAMGNIDGVSLENKRLTLTCHFRRANREHHAAIAAHAERIAKASGLELRAAKMAWELHPQVQWGKGRALKHIVKHLGLSSCAAIYLGDDITDEDVFRSLRSHGLTFHVGHQHETCAEFELYDVDEVARFLEWLGEAREARDSSAG